MTTNPNRFSHVIIGLPGSGKSTLAHQLAEIIPKAQIIFSHNSLLQKTKNTQHQFQEKAQNLAQI